MQRFLDWLSKLEGTYEDTEMKRRALAEHDRRVEANRRIGEIMNDPSYVVPGRTVQVYDRDADPEADNMGPPAWAQPGGQMPTRAVVLPGEVDRQRQYRDAAAVMMSVDPERGFRLLQAADAEPMNRFRQHLTQMHNALAIGDYRGAAQAAQAAYNGVPDGYVASVESIGDGMFRVVRVEEKTGKVEGVHILTAQQLKDEGARLSNPSQFYATNTSAAVQREGHDLQRELANRPSYQLHSTQDGTVLQQEGRTGAVKVIGRYARPEIASGGTPDYPDLSTEEDANKELYRFAGVQPGMLEAMNDDQRRRVATGQRHLTTVSQNTVAATGRPASPVIVAGASYAIGLAHSFLESASTPPPLDEKGQKAWLAQQAQLRAEMSAAIKDFQFNQDGNLDVMRHPITGRPVALYRGQPVGITEGQARFLNAAKRASTGGTQK